MYRNNNPVGQSKPRRAGFWLVLVATTAAAGYGLWYVFLLVLTVITPTFGTLPVLVDDRCGNGKWPDEIRIVTWNLGYGGNGAESSFFLDGGTDVLARSKQSVLGHLSGIANFLANHPADIYLLQEVDAGSRRTYYVDERGVVGSKLPNVCFSYAPNHDAPFVPYPYFRPLGRIRSGILSGSVRKPIEATRYKLPGSLRWPDSAFHLQRCLLLSRFPREHGNEWVVINVHLEAWDDGNVRKQELAFLRDLALDEYKRGNYVIVGGDWNSVLPGVGIEQFSSTTAHGPHLKVLPDGLFPPDWTWGIDRSRASNRRTNTPYRPGFSYETIIDGFVVSPNVHIHSTATANLQFADTDHEPVSIDVISLSSGQVQHLSEPVLLH
jgi:endonuclease/exonuclease/phosphatase family metal-dependent hydrolase